MGRNCSPHSKLAPPRNYLCDKPLAAPAARARAYLRRYAATATMPTTAGTIAGSPFSSLSRPPAGRSDAGLDARRAVAGHPAHRRNGMPPHTGYD